MNCLMIMKYPLLFSAITLALVSLLSSGLRERLQFASICHWYHVTLCIYHVTYVGPDGYY